MTKLRVRARAVDMLGRQQIAGIPTAIHELFKNAHDAYAERVEADFFRRTRVLILRDDGYGMTREDVENRWLTLGTESRIGANRPESIGAWTGPKNLPRRIIMGEKGIGRLAIAVIAPITLLMTRAVRTNGLHNLVVTLVHWGLFEQPGLDIGAIDVPIREFPGGVLPTREDIAELVARVRSNIDELGGDIEDQARDRLLRDLDGVAPIAPDRLDAHLNNDREEPLTLAGDGHGTHFILVPVAPELDDDIDGGVDKEASKVQRNLLGFANTMTGETPMIRTEFRDHHLADEPKSLIGPANFFTSEEYAQADHHFEGSFDEYGQFVGTVKIYGEARPFVCNWVEGRGRTTRCGPFSIRYAYLMGQQKAKESMLPPEEWAPLNDKLERIGGLYIYRNGIRVLPYGNSDYDFLEIERRRSKSAQDWFFSYRRGFGYIAITHENNSSLSEKAGREGFRENQAYRDFRAVLINFIQRLAMEFFRENAPQGERYWEKKKEFDTQSKLLAKEKKKADKRRREFRDTMEKFFFSYESGDFEQSADVIRAYLTSSLDHLQTVPVDGNLAIGVRDLELDVRNRFRSLVSQASIIRPRGLSLTKALEKDWAAYTRMSERIRTEVIEPLRHDIDHLLREVADSRLGGARRREAALQVLEAERETVARELIGLRRETYNATEVMQQTLKKVVRDEFARFQESIETLVTEFTRLTAEKPEELDNARAECEARMVEIRQQVHSLLSSIRRQMEDFTEGLKARETFDDRFAVLEQRNQVLEEQLDFYSEFAQMGMALGILQHEFENTARTMRESMRDMKPWANGTPALNKIYTRLRESFEHLDGYLKVLDPLGRRMQRKTVELSGDEILGSLRRIFRASMEQNGIALETTNAFLGYKVECRSSAILGAFVNIIDNAIYWVANGARGEKVIYLDADDKGFLISNTGPGIEERLRDRIFEFGETTKPGGRGMGLAISKDVLRREGFDLELVMAGENVRPVFRIRMAS